MTLLTWYVRAVRRIRHHFQHQPCVCAVFVCRARRHASNELSWILDFLDFLLHSQQFWTWTINSWRAVKNNAFVPNSICDEVI